MKRIKNKIINLNILTKLKILLNLAFAYLTYITYGAFNSNFGLFFQDYFPPRWICGKWEFWHGWIHIISDGVIAFCYFMIPISILIMYFNIRSVYTKKQHNRFINFLNLNVFLLFAGFIFFCGTSHYIEALIYWHPIYYFSAFNKIITAVISFISMIAIIKTLANNMPLIRYLIIVLIQAVEDYNNEEVLKTFSKDN